MLKFFHGIAKTTAKPIKEVCKNTGKIVLIGAVGDGTFHVGKSVMHAAESTAEHISNAINNHFDPDSMDDYFIGEKPYIKM